MKKYLTLILSLCLIISGSSFAKQDKFKNNLSLQLNGESAAYNFNVPESVYQNVYYSNLSDIRIINASGDFVPMRVVLSSEVIEHKYTQSTLPTFKLNKIQSTPIKTQQIRTTNLGVFEDYTVTTSMSMRKFLENQEFQDDSIVYIDASVLKDKKIEKLSLDWHYTTQGNRMFHVKLLGSNDLSNWQTIKNHHKLLDIKSGSKTLLENSIELNQTPYLFYKLIFKDKIFPKINGVQAHLISQFSTSKNINSSIEKIKLINDNEVMFDTRGYYPIESFKMTFQQKNTMSDVLIYSRDHSKKDWQYVTKGSLFSIMTNGVLYTKNSVNIRRSQNRYWKIRFDKNVKNSEIQSIEFSWRKHQVEFLAQGDGPFVLLYGNQAITNRSSSDWYYKLPKEVKFSNQVTVSDIKESKNEIVTNHSIELGNDNAKITFWIVLVFVMFLLVFMAYKLIEENNE